VTQAALKESWQQHPDDRDTLRALVTFSRDSWTARSALEYAERLDRIAPQDPGLVGLVEGLRRQAEKLQKARKPR
jgi:hypothetical protein